VRRIGYAALLLTYGVVSSAAAPDISVYPVRVTLSRAAAASQLEMGNSGDAPDMLQTQVFRWTRQHCNDRAEPADSIVVSPPIFSVQPNSKQVLRILLVGAASDREEQTMRIVLTEIGIGKPEPGSVATRLAISIPVFVMPTSPAAPDVAWSVVREGSQIRVTAHNVGNAHTRLKALRLIGADGVAVSNEPHSDYLLAGDSCDWTFPAAHLAPGARVIAATEERETTLGVPAP